MGMQHVRQRQKIAVYLEASIMVRKIIDEITERFIDKVFADQIEADQQLFDYIHFYFTMDTFKWKYVQKPALNDEEIFNNIQHTSRKFRRRLGSSSKKLL